MTAAEPTLAALDLVRIEPHHLVRSQTWAQTVADYWALTKPEVNILIIVTTLAGFCLGLPSQHHPFPFLLLIHTLLGTLLVAGGTGTLNQYVERRFDAQMRRTARRPLAAGRLEPSSVLRFGIALSVTGALYLAVALNALASLLAVLTLVSYLFVYTPLKRRTPLCTLAGAFPGAMPPLIGWAAASGRLSPEAWVLYGIVFLWQLPHFMAIAWMYREDYARAGYLVLPFGGRRGAFMAWQTLVPGLALVFLSLTPAFLGHAGVIYLVGALSLSSCFVYYAACLVVSKSNAAARRLLFASVVYLPLVFVLMVIDKV
ncbi:MAG TPA: heme o synthase [Terriglobia bacterium]|nr:heme o synthase [Terriglobia bacterium]